MPTPFRTSLLLVATALTFVASLTSLMAQSRKQGQSRKGRYTFQERVSSRFSTPSQGPAVTLATSATQPVAPVTAVSIMQRQTYLDGQQPALRQRNRVELSFHLLPTLTWNSVVGSGTSARFESPGASLQYSVGPSVDIYVRQNRYALSTGLWYTAKNVGFVHPASDGGGLSTYNLQYIQLPVTMKLISDNLIKTGRTYVQYGVIVDVKVAERALDKARNVFYQRNSSRNQFTPTDFGLLIAVGYERQISPTNSLIVSLQYQRSVINTTTLPELSSKNNLLALGAGLSF
ncbi:hypothetical protein FAES_0684 [Fibrella aestuarina BUZ 2]|uniref:Uncharacterized protein n=1 Tax=Fibrella aestuarina BUZ 2 TaxID=1166018 RepID=I0K3J2_9BACT|nr:outer membrane beta-barrel protein [Fibrella aestuarina]CCG98695.1 hypothetical protein FAES_0684 [Fibrella aestuarina BUZ 2]